jgi:hypothetical protein
MIVEDPDLMKFMQQHDLNSTDRQYFDIGSPMREVFGSLQRLTNHEIDWQSLTFLLHSEDPRRQRMLREVAQSHAERWQTWWEENWQNYTKDEAFHLVKLPALPAADQSPPALLDNTSRIGGGSMGNVVSPADETNRYATRLLDLDIGLQVAWPSNVPTTEEGARSPELLTWAREHGVDLTCVVQKSSDGTPKYVLRVIDMSVVRMSPQDVRNLDKRFQSGATPRDNPTAARLEGFNWATNLIQQMSAGEFLTLDDSQNNEKTAYIYQTKQGNYGLIEITDLITRTSDLTGTPAGMEPRGTGFHRGVQFSHHEIVP